MLEIGSLSRLVRISICWIGEYLDIGILVETATFRVSTMAWSHATYRRKPFRVLLIN